MLKALFLFFYGTHAMDSGESSQETCNGSVESTNSDGDGFDYRYMAEKQWEKEFHAQQWEKEFHVASFARVYKRSMEEDAKSISFLQIPSDEEDPPPAELVRCNAFKPTQTKTSSFVEMDALIHQAEEVISKAEQFKIESRNAINTADEASKKKDELFKIYQRETNSTYKSTALAKFEQQVRITRQLYQSAIQTCQRAEEEVSRQRESAFLQMEPARSTLGNLDFDAIKEAKNELHDASTMFDQARENYITLAEHATIERREAQMKLWQNAQDVLRAKLAAYERVLQEQFGL